MHLHGPQSTDTFHPDAAERGANSMHSMSKTSTQKLKKKKKNPMKMSPAVKRNRTSIFGSAADARPGRSSKTRRDSTVSNDEILISLSAHFPPLYVHFRDLFITLFSFF